MDAVAFVEQLGAANQDILDRLAPAETLVAESGGDLRLENLLKIALKNELEAHVSVYKAIKAAPHGNTSQVGIIKHMHILEPWHVWDRPSCYIANILTNDTFYNFFT